MNKRRPGCQASSRCQSLCNLAPSEFFKTQFHQYLQALFQQRARLSIKPHTQRHQENKTQLAFQRNWSKCLFWSLFRFSSTLSNARQKYRSMLAQLARSLYPSKNKAPPACCFIAAILTDSFLGSSPLPIFFGAVTTARQTAQLRRAHAHRDHSLPTSRIAKQTESREKNGSIRSSISPSFTEAPTTT